MQTELELRTLFLFAGPSYYYYSSSYSSPSTTTSTTTTSTTSTSSTTVYSAVHLRWSAVHCLRLSSASYHLHLCQRSLHRSPLLTVTSYVFISPSLASRPAASPVFRLAFASVCFANCVAWPGKQLVGRGVTSQRCRPS